MKAITQFRLIDIKRLGSEDHMSVTCSSLGSKEGNFQSFIKGDDNYKETLWQYCQCNFRELFVNIEHDGLQNNSTPINPLVTSIDCY